MSAKARIGFVGLGVLGIAMAERLLKRGWPVSVWNRSPGRAELLAPHGGVPKQTPAEVAATSDVVMLCVLDGPAVEEVVFGPGGVAEAKGARTLIDFSTIEPERTVTLAARLKTATGADWIDAPVSGGPPVALNGKLTIMLGGAPDAVARCRPALDDLAGNLTHLGPVGSGQTAKVLNQAIVGVSYVLMAELLALAATTDIDPALLPKALSGGLADSNVLQRIYPLMQAEDFSKPLGYARQLNKDLQALAAFASARGVDLPVIRKAVERYAEYARGNDMADSASVSRLYPWMRK
ncbi:NAD(P)-dependent oxidoreductase [soil metagenome]